jgi:enoyl-CoA hydratase
MCDIILASPTAKFGQPEINLGVIPGGGGTQRLTRIVGKSRAMELMLTGRNFSAEEAERWGMVSKVVGPGEGEVVREALEMAKVIASKGQVAVQAGKEAINAGQWSRYSDYVIWSQVWLFSALELPLSEGLKYERRLFHSLFATHDQKEGERDNAPSMLTCSIRFPGMSAFAEKRKPNFTHS